MVKKVTICIASCFWVLLMFCQCGSLARGPEDSSGVVLAKSTFDAGAEGWSTAGDAWSITFHDTGGSSGITVVMSLQKIEAWLSPGTSLLPPLSLETRSGRTVEASVTT